MGEYGQGRGSQGARALHGMIIETGVRLPYAMNVAGYRHRSGAPSFTDVLGCKLQSYETDLLISDRLGETDGWIPRVVVEFKLGRVSSHDVLSYSAKAATHKTIHPYLRYGFIVGGLEGPVPQRVMRHAQQFDFIQVIPGEQVAASNVRQLVELLAEEVEASRAISAMLDRTSPVRLVRRRLVTSGRPNGLAVATE